MADFHTYSSWGRTRRPKNVNGNTSTAAVVDVGTIVAAKAITDHASRGINKVSLADGVYSTENQRFLHMTSTTGGTVLNVWVYTHASGVWAELLIGGASVTVAAGAHKIVEIAGVDLVAFNLGDTTSVYAACSTF